MNDGGIHILYFSLSNNQSLFPHQFECTSLSPHDGSSSRAVVVVEQLHWLNSSSSRAVATVRYKQQIRICCTLMGRCLEEGCMLCGQSEGFGRERRIGCVVELLIHLVTSLLSPTQCYAVLPKTLAYPWRESLFISDSWGIAGDGICRCMLLFLPLGLLCCGSTWVCWVHCVETGTERSRKKKGLASSKRALDPKSVHFRWV